MKEVKQNIQQSLVLTTDRQVTVKHCLALPAPEETAKSSSVELFTICKQTALSPPVHFKTNLTRVTPMGWCRNLASLMLWLEITRLTDWMFCKHAEAAGGGVSVSERKKNQTKCRLASTRGNYNVMNRLLSGSRTTGALTG